MVRSIVSSCVAAGGREGVRSEGPRDDRPVAHVEPVVDVRAPLALEDPPLVVDDPLARVVSHAAASERVYGDEPEGIPDVRRLQLLAHPAEVLVDAVVDLLGLDAR